MSNPEGRPLKFKTPKEMQEKIDAYFIKCDEDMEPYTITGLALALDTYRQTLLNYENRDEFMDTIKKAKLRVEHSVEKRLYGTAQVTGAIFALKNFDWSDKQDVKVDVTSKGESVAPISRLSELVEKLNVPKS